jgi:hypothetical protein
VAELAGGHLRVGEHRVDLPGLPVGRVDPDLVLHGVATGDLVFSRRGEALGAEPARGGGDVVGRLDLDTEVVRRAASAGALDEDELQRRFGDGEVGVAGSPLGRLGTEQLRVELDGLVDVGDVEGELHAGHAEYLR